MEHIGFPSIRQYTDVVRYVSERMQHAGKDADGNDKWHPHTVQKPKLKFRGTTKFHGANAAVVFNVETGEISYQSRDLVLSLEKDLFGFKADMQHKTEQLRVIYNTVMGQQTELPKYIAIFGEWCGGEIQRGIPLKDLPKMFVWFAVKVVTGKNPDGSSAGHWIDMERLSGLDFPKQRIFHALRFGQWGIEIDFERPKIFQNDLADITVQVEEACPGAKYFGIDGVGEGVVWICVSPGWDPYRFGFKVVGQKHSKSKRRELAPVDIEAVKAVEDFIDVAVTEARLEQGLHHLVHIQHKPFTLTSQGDFARWVYNDIMKEEMETITASGLDPKKLGAPISVKARYWFFAKMEAEKETPKT